MAVREIPSSEFRKSYATLREPVVVTVNGHAIGTWHPVGDIRVQSAWDPRRPDASDRAVGDVLREQARTYADRSAAIERNRVTAAMQEFRPVPKPGSKR